MTGSAFRMYGVPRPAVTGVRQRLEIAPEAVVDIRFHRLRGPLDLPGEYPSVIQLGHNIQLDALPVAVATLPEEAYLVAAVPKYSPRPVRQRSSPPRLVTLSNALLAVTDPRGIPEAAREPERFGAWVENACLAHAWNTGQRVMYWREEPHEVDGILEGTWGSWAIEVKTGPIALADLRGLLEFHRRHPRYRPLVIADADIVPAAARAGIDAISWRRFLLGGPAGVPAGE